MKRWICATTIFLSCVTPAMTAELRVGAAAVNLEADDSMVISGGIGPRYAKGQEGQLRALAVVVERTPKEKIAVVACDVLFVSRDLAEPALEQIERKTGIPPANVLIHATHTHHAPSTTTVHGYRREELFCRRLQDGIVAAVEKANANLSQGPSQFLFAMGEEKTVGQNSRMLMSDRTIFWIGDQRDAVRPTGPFDPQLPVLAFRAPSGRLQALLYNHSTHTIGSRNGEVRSPSFYGLAAQELEQELGGVVGFLEGASGSTHNLTLPAAEASERMKKAVKLALAQARPRSVDRILALKKPFTFKVRNFDEAVEDEKVVSYCRKRAPETADKYIDVFRGMRRELKPQQGQQRQTWLQVLLLGDVAIVGVPAEYFTVLGLDIKKRSPVPNTIVVELANDWIGYLPDRPAMVLGGYQTWMGQHSYAEAGTGERVAEEVVAMLTKLARLSDASPPGRG